VTNSTRRRAVSYAAGLALAAGLTACGGAGSPPMPTPSTPSAATQAPSQPPTQTPAQRTAGRTVSVTVKGKQVTPAPATVDLGIGETLTLTVTSDTANVLHIHGFDVEKELAAGKPLTVTLTGKQPGTYDVETHDPELRLLKIAVR
jgi:plastocyanin